MHRCITINVLHLLDELLLAYFLYVFQDGHDFLGAGEVTLALREKQAPNLVIIVWDYFTELIIGVLVAFFRSDPL